jgi:hypothetical protein
MALTQDGGQVAEALLGGRPSDRAEDATVCGLDRGAGGHHLHLSQAHALAARRLPVCVAGNDPEADPFFPLRHGISRLPEVEGTQPRRQKFERYPVGYFHIDLAEVRTVESKHYPSSPSTALAIAMASTIALPNPTIYGATDRSNA